MAARQGKSQARRTGGSQAPLPGWAWLVIGVLATLLVVLLAPRFLGDGGEEGFFRPQPNPNAQPQPAAVGEEAEGIVPRADSKPSRAGQTATGEQDYDFYTLLPGQEVAMSDEQLAAAEREEAARRQRDAQAAASSLPPAIDAGTADITPASPTSTDAASAQSPVQGTASASPLPAASAAPASNTPYILQAGAFQASGDAEALKAKIALLGLNARVEAATIQGKTMYRVRMGPYGTASELADAKTKLSAGGLPAMAVRAQ